MSDYVFKTTPFPHQKEIFLERRDLVEDAIFWEMGTGKSKLAIDNVAYLFGLGKINGLLIVAPPGVHRNWIVNEIPAHLPDDIHYDAAVWQAAAKKRKRHSEAIERACYSKGLGILAMNYEAFTTKDGRDTAWKFLKNRKTFHLLDESTRIKTPTAKRTKSIIASGEHSTIRRILTGSPISNGPFDAYSQFRFLNQKFWKKFSLDNYTVFKTFFGVWEKKFLSERTFLQCVGFQNLDDLQKIIVANSTRVLKADVLPNLPDKLYRKCYVEMSPKQDKVYKQVRDEAVSFMETGEMIDATLAIVKLLRLQQVLCGYIPVEGGEEPVVQIDPSNNPRVDALMGMIEEAGDQKIVVWAYFQLDVELIAERLKKEGISHVLYYGKTSNRNRATALDKFTGNRPIFLDGRVVGKEAVPKEEQAQIIVMSPSTGAEGLTLVESCLSLIFSCGFKLGERLQLEARQDRIGQENSVLYVDFVVPDTVDEKKIDSLRAKREIAGYITADEMGDWI
jgi:SNF2 family DNA or RNA helicase